MTAERVMTLEQGSKMLREMRWGADAGEDMMRLADAIDAHLSRAAQPVAWVHADYFKPDIGLVYKDECLSSTEIAGSIPLYTHPPEPARDALSRLLVPGLRVYAGDYVVQIDAGKLGLFTERFTDEKDKPRAIRVVQQRAIDAAMAQEPGNG